MEKRSISMLLPKTQNIRIEIDSFHHFHGRIIYAGFTAWGLYYPQLDANIYFVKDYEGGE
jgi:hypothetical protein